MQVTAMFEPQAHVLCRVDELPESGSRGFDPEGCGQATVFAVRRGDLLRVYVDSCPHHGTPMAWRRDAYLNAAGDHIVCAAHGALFEIDTGRCVLGPCLGDRLQPVAWHIAGEELVIALTGHGSPLSGPPQEINP